MLNIKDGDDDDRAECDDNHDSDDNKECEQEDDNEESDDSDRDQRKSVPLHAVVSMKSVQDFLPLVCTYTVV